MYSIYPDVNYDWYVEWTRQIINSAHGFPYRFSHRLWWRPLWVETQLLDDWIAPVRLDVQKPGEIKTESCSLVGLNTQYGIHVYLYIYICIYIQSTYTGFHI